MKKTKRNETMLDRSFGSLPARHDLPHAVRPYRAQSDPTANSQTLPRTVRAYRAR